MRRAILTGAVAALLAAAPAAAQQPTTPRQPTPAAADTSRRPAAVTPDTMAAQDTTAQDTTSVVCKRVRPGIAFFRSILIPGWGQISMHAYKRAAVFIALQGASDFMLIKTLNKLKQAEDREKLLRPAATDTVFAHADSAIAQDYRDNPARLSAVLDTLPIAGHGLVVSRKKQREDWITLAVFWTLISGVDAFINAQLQDFPADVGVEPRPNGGAEIRATVPLRRFW